MEKNLELHWGFIYESYKLSVIALQKYISYNNQVFIMCFK